MDWQASVLGIGVMRLPLAQGTPAAIDESASIEIIRYAIDHGANYLDLGYPYDLDHQKAISTVVRKALQDRYREKVRLAANFPAYMLDTSTELNRLLDRQLRWLEVDNIDFSLIGGMDRETWTKLDELKIIRHAELAIDAGKTSRLGFTFHDQFQYLRNVLNAYDKWAVSRFQYSLMDVDHHPGVSGLQLAARSGLAVVVTEPLKSNRLIKNIPEPVAKIWNEASPQRSPMEWVLRWVWNHPEIATAVVDLNTLEQAKEAIALADNAEADNLSVMEEVMISSVREAYRKLRPIPCTACRSCMPCPQGIDVPRIFEIYLDSVMFSDIETARELFRAEGHRIDICTDCGKCARTCGRSIDIPKWLKEAGKQLL